MNTTAARAPSTWNVDRVVYCTRQFFTISVTSLFFLYHFEVSHFWMYILAMYSLAFTFGFMAIGITLNYEPYREIFGWRAIFWGMFGAWAFSLLPNFFVLDFLYSFFTGGLS